ncbi:MAG: hypothetical protein ACTHM0_11025 [Sphingomonas sp.]
MAFVRQRPPGWFWWISALLALWGLLGCYFCLRQFLYGADAMGPADEYRRTLYASLPAWYDYVYAVATGAALLGGLALLRRAMAARVLFVVSAIAVVVQFGWLFATTDLLAAKGVVTAILPLVILGIAIYSIRFAARARRFGWIC